MDSFALIVELSMGCLVLVSYLYIFGTKCKSNYLSHPFWVGIPKSTVKVLIPMQLFAVCGFLVGVGSWIKDPPTSGVMGTNKYAFAVTLGVFLSSSAIWPVATYKKVHWLVVGSLLLAAASSALMLAGSIEEQNSRWWITMSFIALSIVTIVNDGILWNAKYIHTLLHNPKKLEQMW